MLKAIIFDFDGVIVDSEPLHYRAFLQTVQELGIRFDYAHYLEQLVGYDDRDVFGILLARTRGAPPEAGPQAYRGDQAAINRLVNEKASAFAQIVAQGVEPVPGVLAFLEQLPAELPIAIASGATQADIRLVLRVLGLIERFDCIVADDDVVQSKPHRQTYDLAVIKLAERHSQLDLQPADCLAIEDTPAGLQSARTAGLHTLALTTTTTAEQLHQAHHITESFKPLNFTQLQQWFSSQHNVT